MPYPSDETIAELKAKHGATALHLLEYDDGGSAAIVCRQPPKVEWDRMVATTAADRASAPRALENFVRACCVWPTPSELDRIFADWPALPSRFGEELSTLAGSEQKVRAKKL